MLGFNEAATSALSYKYVFYSVIKIIFLRPADKPRDVVVGSLT